MKRKELKRKELMAALLASAAAEPPRVFDPDCMTRIHDCHSIIEALRLIKHGGSEWASRYVSMWFDGASNGWVLVYPLQETSEPYFDFMYTGDLAPQKVFAALLAKYPQCRVMDWAVGRIACVIVEGGEVEILAEIIRAFTEAAWGEGVAVVDVSYEEMGRA